MRNDERFGPLPGLTEKVTELKGSFRDAASAPDESVTAAKDTWAEFSETLRKTVRERPYTSMALAAGLGVLYALARR